MERLSIKGLRMKIAWVYRRPLLWLLSFCIIFGNSRTICASSALDNLPLLTQSPATDIGGLENDSNAASLYVLLQTIDEITQSEDFQQLMEYPEMQELMLEALKSTINFAATDPETTRQFLEAMEVEEPYINLFLFSVSSGMLTSEKVEELWKTEEEPKNN